jgi:hypothetical protein
MPNRYLPELTPTHNSTRHDAETTTGCSAFAFGEIEMTYHTHDKTLPPAENREAKECQTDALSLQEDLPAPDKPYLFRSGKIVSTPGALEALEMNHYRIFTLLLRHLTGDWGDVPAEDAAANREALANGLRILSSYPQPSGARIWIITEADRSATTVLLPEEY